MPNNTTEFFITPINFGNETKYDNSTFYEVHLLVLIAITLLSPVAVITNALVLKAIWRNPSLILDCEWVYLVGESSVFFQPANVLLNDKSYRRWVCGILLSNYYIINNTHVNRTMAAHESQLLAYCASCRFCCCCTVATYGTVNYVNYVPPWKGIQRIEIVVKENRKPSVNNYMMVLDIEATYNMYNCIITMNKFVILLFT